MGFLSSLLGVAAPLAGAFLGVTPTPAAAAPAPVAPAPKQLQLAQIPQKPSVLDLAEPIAKTSFVGGPLTSEDLVRARPGTSKNRVRTIVQSIAPNGSIVSQEFLEGRPFLMNKDIVQMKRTIALIGDADERLPRPRQRGVKQGKENAKLKGILEGLNAAAAMAGRSITTIDTGS